MSDYVRFLSGPVVSHTGFILKAVGHIRGHFYFSLSGLIVSFRSELVRYTGIEYRKLLGLLKGRFFDDNQYVSQKLPNC